jgi:hypothetical protein
MDRAGKRSPLQPGSTFIALPPFHKGHIEGREVGVRGLVEDHVRVVAVGVVLALLTRAQCNHVPLRCSAQQLHDLAAALPDAVLAAPNAAVLALAQHPGAAAPPCPHFLVQLLYVNHRTSLLHLPLL